MNLVFDLYFCIRHQILDPDVFICSDNHYFKGPTVVTGENIYTLESNNCITYYIIFN